MFSTAQSDRFTDPQDQDLLDPVLDSAKFRRRLLPRFGLSYRFGPGRALHFAYQESLRAPGTHTLAPVSTGAIAVDNQYLLAGSFARKKAMQLDWELGPRSFLGASLSGQSIANPVAATGRLFAQNTSALFDNVGTLAPPLLNAQTSLNTYEETPIFDRGTLTQASVGLNQLVGARWGLLGQYTYTHSRNTGAVYEGNLLPGFARHVLLGQATWRQTARSFALLRLTWRGERYADQANLNLREPGWSLALAQAWQSPDRHWSVTGTLQTALSGERSPTVWVLVRWRGQ
jgi:outer membrane receptor protein involved in Fe transport